jgi:MAP3K TRAFs-binding domain
VSSSDGASGVFSSQPPLCHVALPIGDPDPACGARSEVVYEELLAPAARKAGLEPVRADHRPDLQAPLVRSLLEQLVLADYAIVDLTGANPNLLYELGVRSAARPGATVVVGAEGTPVPANLQDERILFYSLDPEGRPADVAGDRAALVEALAALREPTRLPVFQLVDDLPRPDIDRLKTDVFRQRAAYSDEMKGRLSSAREEGPAALRLVAQQLGRLEEAEAGVLVDLLLSFRATESWPDMVELVAAMPEPLRRAVLVREQYAFALNRCGRGEEAERVLLDLLVEQGDSGETLGLLGRVYKDRWQARWDPACLEQAVETYRRGFEADWRDAYLGVNAVTLMEIRDPGGEAQQGLLPVVRYANQRRIEEGEADYWDHATRLELDVVGGDEAGARSAAAAALAAVREPWEPRSTAYNLSLIREARARRCEEVPWAAEIERELERAAVKP